MCNKMSDVRLSNASPTLERVEARQPENLRTSARRNLFGPVDRVEIQRYVAATLQENVQAFRERYNFDPVEDRPLSPRDYEWEEEEDPPEFYLRSPHRSAPDLPTGAGASTREDEAHGAAAERKTSRKRPSTDSGDHTSDCQTKVLHTDKNDDDGSDGGSSQQIDV